MLEMRPPVRLLREVRRRWCGKMGIMTGHKSKYLRRVAKDWLRLVLLDKTVDQVCYETPDAARDHQERKNDGLRRCFEIWISPRDESPLLLLLLLHLATLDPSRDRHVM